MSYCLEMDSYKELLLFEIAIRLDPDYCKNEKKFGRYFTNEINDVVQQLKKSSFSVLTLSPELKNKIWTSEYINKLKETFSLSETEFNKIKGSIINKKTYMRQIQCSNRDDIPENVGGKIRQHIDDLFSYIRAKIFVEIFKHEKISAVEYFSSIVENVFILYSANGYLKKNIKHGMDKQIGAKLHTDFGFLTISIATARGLKMVINGKEIDPWQDGEINICVQFGRIMEEIFAEGGLSFKPKSVPHKVDTDVDIRFFIGQFCDPNREAPVYTYTGKKLADHYGELFGKWMSAWIANSV